jgi:hypothetical protein
MAVADVANLLLSGAALTIAAAALRIARRQVVLDEQSLHIAERESRQADQERNARSALVVAANWEPNGGVSHATSMNAPFSVTITIRNDGARDATDVVVALLAPVSEFVDMASLHLGQLVPRTEERTVDGEVLTFRRYERTLERVRSVPQEVTGSVELWRRGPYRTTEPLSAPVVVEVRCADQPEGHETQVWEHGLQWILPSQQA